MIKIFRPFFNWDFYIRLIKIDNKYQLLGLGYAWNELLEVTTYKKYYTYGLVFILGKYELKITFLKKDFYYGTIH